MNREEHLEWAKKRALEYLDAGDIHNAFASMASDVNKHPELKGHPGFGLGLMLLASGNLRSVEEMRRWIVGFN